MLINWAENTIKGGIAIEKFTQKSFKQWDGYKKI
jgi:hypothetical protein